MAKKDKDNDTMHIDDEWGEDNRYKPDPGWRNPPTNEERLEEAKKKSPRLYAGPPEMLMAMRAEYWIESASKRGAAGQLCGPFWLENELAIMFSGTGMGKSALGLQIAESTSRGVTIAPFETEFAASLEPRRVIYIDFELSREQFAMRYSLVSNDNKTLDASYQFAPGLIRAELYWNGQIMEGYDGFSDMFFTSLEDLIEESGSSVLILDNITFLERRSTASAQVAMSIMRGLSDLKRKRLVSILALAHTPKRRSTDPLTEMDLQGSINLGNFADSIFAIGRSRRSPDLRYLKQVKVRTGRVEFGAAHVPVFRLGKFDLAGSGQDNFLGFSFVEFGRESDHLDLRGRYMPNDLVDKRTRHKNTIDIVKRLAAQGKTSGKIAVELGIPRSTAFRYMRRA